MMARVLILIALVLRLEVAMALHLPENSTESSTRHNESEPLWNSLTQVLQRANGERRLCGNGRHARFTAAQELRKITDGEGLENSTGSHFCPSLTFDVGNQDGASGTVAAAELHFDFVISPTDVFFLDTYSFRIYQEFFDGSRALVNFATITATSQHMCLDITPALRTSQEGRLQTMTIIIDVLLNGVLNCSASMSSLVHLQTGNSTNVTAPFQPFGSSTTVFAFYQMSQTMPFFSRLFRQASDINLYRAVPPESWSRRDVERCRVHRFTLDITPIGAVSPANITFGICSGTCYSPLIKPVPFTHNAQLRSLLNAYDYVPARDRPIMPCCSPAQDSHFEGQSVIVSEPDGKMVIKFLGDLIPTRCGCF